jgi:hypothetical protein
MTALDTAPVRQRAPRGSRTVSQAFFAALEAIPEARRQEVAKAAQAAIREELKLKQRKQPAARRRVMSER